VLENRVLDAPDLLRWSAPPRPSGGAVAALTAVAYFLVFADLVDEAALGMRTTFLIVAPVLMAPVVLASRVPARDVADSLPDWVSAALVAAPGFAVLHVLVTYGPALVVPWALPLLSVALWSAGSTIVLFGAQYARRLWPLWLMALGGATPAVLAAWTHLGGSGRGAVALFAVAGAIGVVVTARRLPVDVAPAAAICAAALATATVLTLGGHAGLPLGVSALGVLPPALAVCAVCCGTRRHRAMRLRNLRIARP
jgi:hypothetical protein